PGKSFRKKRAKSLTCQQLEDRITPATVTIFDDIDTPGNTSGSLRDAIDIVNASPTDNIIDFGSKFDSLSQPIQLFSSLPIISETVTIVGFSDNSFVKIDGNGQFIALHTASSDVTVTVTKGLTIQNSLAGIGIDGGGTFKANNLHFHDTFNWVNDTRA